MSLDQFGVTVTGELRTPNPRFEEFGLDTLECPCGAPITLTNVGTVEVDPSEFTADALTDLDDPLICRGWDCEDTSCKRRLVETLELAEHHGEARDLRRGWYPVRVTVDDPDQDSAVVFTPKKEIVRRLDRADHPAGAPPRGGRGEQ